jgi:two-component system cell cycle response regulator
MLNILHVDRSELFRSIMKELVYRCGHSCLSVSTIEAALQAISTGAIDLVITALALDDGSGEILIKELASDDRRMIPAIVVTSTDSLELRERLFSLGVVDYLMKQEVSEERLRRYFDSLEAEDELSRFMRSIRIAVLDDSALILKIVAKILTMNGIQSFRLFEDPLELFGQDERFDLYLCDIILPNMSGEQVVSRIRRESPDSIILSMSRISGEKPLLGILHAGADDYLHKPFDAAALMSRLRINARAYQLKKRLERLALVDGLTDLFNHRHAYERLEQEVEKSRRYHRALSVVMMDLDDFKQVNDTCGHMTGDELLVAVARSIREHLRAADIAGRYGGEEFIMILPETDLDASRKVAEKMRNSVATIRLAHGLGITASFGIAQWLDDESAAALVSRADNWLYQSKRNGKNCVNG